MIDHYDLWSGRAREVGVVMSDTVVFVFSMVPFLSVVALIGVALVYRMFIGR